MDVKILEQTIDKMADHGKIAIAFEYTSILELIPVQKGLGGFLLEEKHLPEAQFKDYDAHPGAAPVYWSNRFDIANWGLFTVFNNGNEAGGAVIAYDTEGLDMLEDRRDLALLWDIRISPESRGQGLGARLFYAVESWCRARQCKQLKIETQNINAAACRFYAAQGCNLGVINRFAYPDFPEEVQMIWYKNLL